MSKGTRFTDKYIMNLKPAAKEYWVREGRGFAIRVYSSGEKAWYYIYTFNERKRFMRLGNGGYPDVSLANAREEFDRARVKVSSGIDPLTEKQFMELDRKLTPTVAEFITEFIERYSKVKQKGWKEVERSLNANILPKWGDRKITDIRRRDIRPILDELIDRGAPIMANRVLAYTRKMFSFAVNRDVIEANPFLKMSAPAEENDRERYLAVDEIKTLWGNLEKAKMSDETRRALKFILVTGQRPGEVVGMHGHEIDGRWWTIPAERCKNKEAHRVFLTDTAIELIGDREGYIFESCKKPGTSTTERALTHAINRSCPRTEKEAEEKKTVNLLGINYFTPHDLRRTASTHMAEAEIPEHTIDQIQNHIAKRRRGVTHIYVRYSYDREKQAAMETWERKLSSIITGKGSGKVVSITKAKGKVG